MFSLMNMEFTQKLQRLLDKRGLKRSHIINATGANKSTVSTWFSGVSTPSTKYLPKLCRLLQCDSEWLLDDNQDWNYSVKEPNAVYKADFDAWEEADAKDSTEVSRPIFTSVDLAAGPGALASVEDMGHRIKFSLRTLNKCGVIPENAYGVKITGNSLEPVIPDGATAGVDTGATNIKDGKLYAFEQGGLLRVKLLYKMPGGRVRIASYNKTEYPDETEELESEDFRIIGRIFWYSALI